MASVLRGAIEAEDVDLTDINGIEIGLQPALGEHRACHQYVDDMLTPAEMLILSRDEYLDIAYPWEQPA